MNSLQHGTPNAARVYCHIQNSITQYMSIPFYRTILFRKINAIHLKITDEIKRYLTLNLDAWNAFNCQILTKIKACVIATMNFCGVYSLAPTSTAVYPSKLIRGWLITSHSFIIDRFIPGTLSTIRDEPWLWHVYVIPTMTVCGMYSLTNFNDSLPVKIKWHRQRYIDVENMPHVAYRGLGPLLLTWINLNHSMDK